MDVLMPQLGETVLEGTVAVWYKGAGDSGEAKRDNLSREAGRIRLFLTLRNGEGCAGCKGARRRNITMLLWDACGRLLPPSQG